MSEQTQKKARQTCQLGVRKANESEPSMRVRNFDDDIETKLRKRFEIGVEGDLLTDHVVSGL